MVPCVLKTILDNTQFNFSENYIIILFCMKDAVLLKEIIDVNTNKNVQV